MRYGRGRDGSKSAFGRASGAPSLTHCSALERAAESQPRPIYSVFHGLSAGIFRLNFRSLDLEFCSSTCRTLEYFRAPFARTFPHALLRSVKTRRSSALTYLLSFSRAIRWYLQIEFS